MLIWRNVLHPFIPPTVVSCLDMSSGVRYECKCEVNIKAGAVASLRCMQIQSMMLIQYVQLQVGLKLFVCSIYPSSGSAKEDGS